MPFPQITFFEGTAEKDFSFDCCMDCPINQGPEVGSIIAISFHPQCLQIVSSSVMHETNGLFLDSVCCLLALKY